MVHAMRLEWKALFYQGFFYGAGNNNQSWEGK